MAQMTVLEMVQSIASSLGSDQINSINDTPESQQIAEIVKCKYYDILVRGNLPEQQTLFQLDASGSVNTPTLMYMPTGISRLDWLKYYDMNPANSAQQDQFGSYSHGVNTNIVNPQQWTTTSSSTVTVGTGSKVFIVASSSLHVTVGQGVLCSSGSVSMFGNVVSYVGTTLTVNISSTIGAGTYSSWILTTASQASVPGYKYVTGLPIDQFLDMINRFNPTDPTVGSYEFSEGGRNYTFYYKTNIQPQYYTVLENYFVIFDSYDSGFDTTLQTSKTMAFGLKLSPFTVADNFIPDLDDEQFPLLINEAKALAYFELKQMGHPKAEQEIKRQWSTVQKNKSVSNKPSHFDQLANFGRVPRTGGYASGGYGAYKWMRQSGP